MTMSPADMLNNDAIKNNYRIFIFHKNNVIQSGRHQIKLHKQRGKLCVKNNELVPGQQGFIYFLNSYMNGSVALLSSGGSSPAACAPRLNTSLFLTSCFASCPAAPSSVCEVQTANEAPLTHSLSTVKGIRSRIISCTCEPVDDFSFQTSLLALAVIVRT